MMMIHVFRFSAITYRRSIFRRDSARRRSLHLSRSLRSPISVPNESAYTTS